MTKYFKVFLFNLKSELSFKVDFIASIFSFTIHVAVFNFLWDFILGSKLSFGYTKNQLIWYVIIAELVTYATSKGYRKISIMIKSGDVSNMLIKPINFLGYIACGELTSIVRFMINSVFATILGICMAGTIKLNIINIIYFGFAVIFSLLLIISFQIFIGMLAFITEENKAFYNVIIKLILILLFTPLEFFSKRTQIVLKLLPTTYVLYPSSKIFVKFNLQSDIYLLLGQIISIVAMWTFIFILYKKGVKNLNVNGG